MPTVTMQIPPSRAGLMAQIFQEEGFQDVSWEAPMEKRAGGPEAELIQVIYSLGGYAVAGVIGGAAYAAAQAAVRRIRERFPDLQAEVSEEDG